MRIRIRIKRYEDRSEMAAFGGLADCHYLLLRLVPRELWLIHFDWSAIGSGRVGQHDA
jgi:hypothetical protein